MNGKYKPGDKVTIVSDLEVEGKGIIVSEMKQYAGKKATIVKTSHGFYRLDVDNSQWWWHPDLLTNCNIITLDSIIQIGNIVCTFVGKEKDFLRNDIVEIRSNRSAVKLRDWDKWIPIQQIHADVEMLADKISSDSDYKVYYQSPYLGRIELIEYDSSEEYPLLIKTSDGDEFELTLEGKLFKDSQISVL